MYRVLKEVDQKIALWYPVLRIAEFAVSTVCGLASLIQSQVVPNYLLWVYIPTGIGGLVLLTFGCASADSRCSADLALVLIRGRLGVGFGPSEFLRPSGARAR